MADEPSRPALPRSLMRLPPRQVTPVLHQVAEITGCAAAGLSDLLEFTYMTITDRQTPQEQFWIDQYFIADLETDLKSQTQCQNDQRFRRSLLRSRAKAAEAA